LSRRRTSRCCDCCITRFPAFVLKERFFPQIGSVGCVLSTVIKYMDSLRKRQPTITLRRIPRLRVIEEHLCTTNVAGSHQYATCNISVLFARSAVYHVCLEVDWVLPPPFLFSSAATIDACRSDSSGSALTHL
jgi:hypothetical protein